MSPSLSGSDAAGYHGNCPTARRIRRGLNLLPPVQPPISREQMEPNAVTGQRNARPGRSHRDDLHSGKHNHEHEVQWLAFDVLATDGEDG